MTCCRPAPRSVAHNVFPVFLISRRNTGCPPTGYVGVGTPAGPPDPPPPRAGGARAPCADTPIAWSLHATFRGAFAGVVLDGAVFDGAVLDGAAGAAL